MTFLQTLIGLHAPLQLEIGLRVALALGVIALAALGLRRAGASRDPVAAHRVLSVALLGMLATPLIAVTLPTLPVAYDLPQGFAHVDNPPHMGPIRLTLASLLGADGAAATSRAFRGPGPLAWLAAAWLVGAVGLGMRQAAGFARLRRRGFAGETSKSDSAPTRIERLARRAGSGLDLRAPIRVAVSDAYAVPLTFGWFRPVVLLPEASAGWSDATVVAALRHELSHVSRRDWFWQVVGLVACTLFWFHPLVWWVAREQRRMAELAADADVVGQGIRPSTYARALLEVATGQAGRPGRRPLAHPRATVALSPASTLEHRIAALAARREQRRGAVGVLLVVLVGVIVATAVSAPVYAAGCHADALKGSQIE